jgi:DNA-binding CsgD family transcriptional regulator
VAARSIVHRALDATPAGDLGGELAEAVVAFGDDADVERAIERFGKTVVMPNDLKSTVEKLMVDARLAARLNRPLESARYASSLATLTRNSGQWLLLAHALDLVGDFEGARAELERVGALAELTRMEHGAKRGRGALPTAKLTSREEQIARLAVAGLSSREAAERLAIAPRTVETHLANAYEKLRIRSRAELTAYFESLPEADG